MAYRWNREKKLVREKFAYASAYLRFFIVTNDGGELSDAITEGLFLCNKKCNKSGSLNSLNLD